MNRKIELLLFLLIIIVFVSCTSNVKHNETVDTENIRQIKEIESVEEDIEEFYQNLGNSNYDSCIMYFRKQLRSNPGDEFIINGLNGRNEKMGVTKDYKILYSYENKNIEPIIGFHIMCFNSDGVYHFENIAFVEENEQYLIDKYEFSNMPYVSVEEANDTASLLNSFLKKMYQVINSDDFNEVIKIVDNEVVERLGMEKLRVGFEKEIAKKFEIVDFEVEKIAPNIKEGIPLIEMEIIETSVKGVYRSSVTLVVRADGYKVAIMKDVPVVTTMNVNESDLLDEDLILKYVNGFYDALKQSAYKNIISYVDNDVFKNNSKESIIKSFENRNSFFGIPTKVDIESISTDKINDRFSVYIDLIIDNKSGKTSKEQIVLIKDIKGNYKLYAYEYSELISKG